VEVTEKKQLERMAILPPTWGALEKLPVV
jgi:hypothetical protein